MSECIDRQRERTENKLYHFKTPITPFPPSALRSGVGDGRGRPCGLVGGGAGSWLLLRRHFTVASWDEDDPQGKRGRGLKAGLL